jgi:hypothetical protein
VRLLSPVMIPAVFVMSRQMCRGVKLRAERTTEADLRAIAEPSERNEFAPGP